MRHPPDRTATDTMCEQAPEYQQLASGLRVPQVGPRAKLSFEMDRKGVCVGWGCAFGGFLGHPPASVVERVPSYPDDRPALPRSGGSRDSTVGRCRGEALAGLSCRRGCVRYRYGRCATRLGQLRPVRLSRFPRRTVREVIPRRRVRRRRTSRGCGDGRSQNGGACPTIPLRLGIVLRDADIPEASR